MITLEKSALVSGLEVMVQILLLFECSLRLAPSCYTGVAGFHRSYVSPPL